MPCSGEEDRMTDEQRCTFVDPDQDGLVCSDDRDSVLHMHIDGTPASEPTDEMACLGDHPSFSCHPFQP
jgi:hypothetical protein